MSNFKTTRKMKKIISVIVFALLCGAVFTSCGSNIEEYVADYECDTNECVVDCDSDTGEIIPPRNPNALHLFWNHWFGSEFRNGRAFLFSFTKFERFENCYKLVFEYQIDNNHKTIEIRLVDKIDRGRPSSPSMGVINDDGLCLSGGFFLIPEHLLNNGEYKLIVKTENFTVQSEFIITEEMATLNIPENNYLSSEWQSNEMPIIPKNVIYGSVSVKSDRSENIGLAFDFFESGKALGVLKNIDNAQRWRLRQLRDWGVNEDGSRRITNMGNVHNVSFLYSISCISAIVEFSKRYFDSENAIDFIWFFSTNGDRVTLCRERGVSILLAEN